MNVTCNPPPRLLIMATEFFLVIEQVGFSHVEGEAKC